MKILHKIRKFYTQIILFAVALSAVLFCVFSYNIEYNRIGGFLNASDENIFVKCIVASYPKFKEETVSFCADVLECEKEFLRGRKLYVTMSKDIPQASKISYHDSFTFNAKVQSATPLRNPGGFDFESYVKGLGCVGNVYVSKETFEAITSEEKSIIYQFRRRFIGAADKHFMPTDSAMIKAIVSGDRDEMNEDISEALKRSGVYHIVAISGLHLNLFTCVVAYLIGKLRMKRLMKSLLSFVACMTVALLVLMFTGFGISVWRALIMMSVFCFSSLVSRDYSAKNSLLVSGCIILITMPCSLWNVSFQLSFLSTMAVLVSIDVVRKLGERGVPKELLKSAIVQTFIVSLLAILFTLPVTVASFGYITVYSWLANLLILPAVPYLLGSGVVFALASAIGIGWITRITSYAATSFSRYVIIIAQKVSELPGSTVEVNYGSVILALCVILTAAAIAVFAYKKDFRKSICTILVFVIAWSMFLVYNINSDKIYVTFADVGQGDSTIIQSGENCVMIDCGTLSSETHTASEIGGILRDGGAKAVDMLIVSHLHKDHTNVITELMKTRTVKNLVLPRYYDFIETEAKNVKHSLVDCALRSGTKIYYASEGSVFSVGKNMRFEFLSPSADMFESNNEMSAVVKFTYGNNTMLFCGDIEEAGMENLMEADTECDIMKVAHHGGKSESTQAFLKTASPEYAIISCGENNRYGHPHQTTIDALKTQGCKIFRTDTDGAITIVANMGEILEINTMR